MIFFMKRYDLSKSKKSRFWVGMALTGVHRLAMMALMKDNVSRKREGQPKGCLFRKQYETLFANGMPGGMEKGGAIFNRPNSNFKKEVSLMKTTPQPVTYAGDRISGAASAAL